MAGKIALTDIRLMVDYSDKDEAFKIGAKWDKGTKVWFAPKGADLNDFTKFMGDKTVVLKDTKLYVNFNDKEREKYGNNCHITIAGDNDHKSEKNVGVETATKVAEKVGATVIIPQFTEEQMKQGYTDFNDYAKANGKLKLKEAIEKGDDKLIKQQKQKEIER